MDKDTMEARFGAWYCNEEWAAEWPGRDNGESMAEYIVRNDVPVALGLIP